MGGGGGEAGGAFYLVCIFHNKNARLLNLIILFLYHSLHQNINPDTVIAFNKDTEVK